MLSGLRSTNCLKRATWHLFPPTENIRGWKPLFLLCSAPCLVFVGPSVNCTNSTPSSFLQNWKSSIFIVWCSWRLWRPKNCVKSYHIEEISASGVLEPNFSAFHSTSSSSQLNFWLYLDLCPYQIGEAAELSPLKLAWKSGTPCLLWWKTCILSQLNICKVQLSSLLSCLVRSRHRFCFLLQRKMFQVGCLIFLAHFPRFGWQYFLFVPHLPYIQQERCTLYCVWVFGKNF